MRTKTVTRLLTIAAVLMLAFSMPVVASAQRIGADPLTGHTVAAVLVRAAGGELEVRPVTGGMSTVAGAALADGAEVVLPIPAIEVSGAAGVRDPERTEQTYLDMVDFERAWPRHDGRGVLVAVVDSGVDSSHEDLSGGRVEVGECYLGGAGTPCTAAEAAEPLHPHGTGVVSLIGATTANGRGIAGAAPGARVRSIRVLGSDNNGNLSDVTAGILAAGRSGAKVINLSLQVNTARFSQATVDLVSDLFQTVIDDVTAGGALVVAAAGNYGASGNPVVLPAALPDVLAVGSLETANVLATSSTTGPYVDVVAPGVNLLTAGQPLGSGYVRNSGTSFAAPLVAAQAALLAGADPTATPAMLASWIMSTAQDQGVVGRDDNFGHGLIDPAAALTAAGVSSPPALEIVATQDGTTTIVEWSGGSPMATEHLVSVDGTPAVVVPAPSNGTSLSTDDRTHAIEVVQRVHYLLVAEAGPARVPAPPTLSAEVSGTTAQLSWERRGSVVIDRFELLRDGVVIGDFDAATRSHADPDLPLGSTPQYRVVAIGRTGRAVSPAVSITVPEPPGLPVSVSVVRVGGEVDLTWTDPIGTVTTIAVVRDGTVIATLDGSVRSFRDATPPLGVPVTYVVTFSGPLGSVSTAGVAVTAAEVPTPPSVTIVPTLEGPRLSWRATGGTLVGWRVERDGAVVAELGVDATSFVDTGAPPETVVAYVVTAVGPFETASSSPQSTLVAVVPVAPQDLVAERVGGEVRLTWSAPAGTVESVSILRDGAEIVRLPTDARVFVDSSPPLGVTLEYAVTVAGPLGVGRSHSVTTVAAVQPTPPSISVVQGGQNVVVSWLGATGTITGYRIVRDGEVIAELPPGAERYTDRQPPEGVPLAYAVVATGPYEEVTSETVSVTVAFAIQLGSFNVRQVGATAEITWTVSGTVSSIVVLRDSVEIARLEGSARSFVDVAPPPHVVSVYVIVVDGPLATVTSSPFPIRMVFAPIAPPDLRAERDGEMIRLTWGEPGGTVDALRVRRNGSLVAELAPGERSFDDLPPLGVELRYVIDAVGPELVDRSDAITTLAAVAPMAPLLQVAPIFDNDVEVTWEGATGTIREYRVVRNGETVATLGPNVDRWIDFLEASDEGVQWRYVVVAVGFYGEEATTAEQAIIVARPVSVRAFARQRGSEVEIDWVVGGTVTELEIRRDGDVIATVDPAVGVYFDATAPPHEESTYTVTAVGPLERVTSSAVVVRLVFRPVAPDFVSATFVLDARQVHIAWGEPGGTVDEIEVRRDGVLLRGSLPAETRSIIDPAPRPGVVHRYVVRFIGPEGTAVSRIVEVEAAAPPVAPEIVVLRQLGGSVEVEWSLPQGTVTEIVVERDSVPVARLAAGTTSFIDVGPPAHATSTYRISVSGPLGDDISEAVSIRVVFEPVAPATIGGRMTDGTVVITWGDPGGTVDEIVVRRNGAVLAGLDRDARTFVDTSPPTATGVIYDVVIRGPLGEAASAAVAVATLGLAAAPVVLSAATGPGRLDLEWASPADTGGSAVTGYVVSVSSGGRLLQRLTTPVGTASLSGLPRGVTVDYTIAALTNAGSGRVAAGSARIPRTGYWMLGVDGSLYAFGESRSRTPDEVLAPARALLGAGDAAIAFDVTATGEGIVVLYRSGEVVALGDATDHGDALGVDLDPGERPAAISLTPQGGYWVFTDRGRVIARGPAVQLDDLYTLTTPDGIPLGRTLNGPIISSVGTPTGLGYYLVASDGGVFSFGDAVFRGSMGGVPLNQPVVGLAPTPDNSGYWLVAADGGVFAFNAPFRGSLPGLLAGRPLNASVNGLVPSGSGYLMVAADGGVFAFGSDVDFEGSLGGQDAPTIVDISALR